MDWKRKILQFKNKSEIIRNFIQDTIYKNNFDWNASNNFITEITIQKFLLENLDGDCKYSLFLNRDYSEVLFIVGRDENETIDDCYYTSTILYARKQSLIGTPQKQLVKLLNNKKFDQTSCHIISIDTLNFPSIKQKENGHGDKYDYNYKFRRNKEKRLTKVYKLNYLKTIQIAWNKFPHKCDLDNLRIIFNWLINESQLKKYFNPIVNYELSITDFENSNNCYCFDINNVLIYFNNDNIKKIDKYLSANSLIVKRDSNKYLNYEEYCFANILLQFGKLFYSAYKNKNIALEHSNLWNNINSYKFDLKLILGKNLFE